MNYFPPDIIEYNRRKSQREKRIMNKNSINVRPQPVAANDQSTIEGMTNGAV
jgi:hypothetical protein